MIILNLKNVKLPRINDRYDRNFSLKKEYRERKEELEWQIAASIRGMKPIVPPYAVVIEVGTHYDLDSFVKPLLDSMQKAGAIDNDKNILGLAIDKTTVKRNEANWIKVDLSHYAEKTA